MHSLAAVGLEPISNRVPTSERAPGPRRREPRTVTWKLIALLGSPAMIALLASAATSKDIGLLATFLGIGLIVNIIVVFIAVQVRGERQQNQDRLSGPDRSRQV